MIANEPGELQRLYTARFANDLQYRGAVWRVLIAECFQRHVSPDAKVLDLGCGYGEFINQIQCGGKYAMDLNPDTPRHLLPDVKVLVHDCAEPWPLPDASLDLVFTSNFFEHLPDKDALGSTLKQVQRCLKPGGQLIALGPNIRHLAGAYWDFWDHHLPLTERSLCEALRIRGFEITRCLPKFLPYTMARGPKYPLWCLTLYLKLSPLQAIFGRQFLVIARTGHSR